MTYYLTLVVVIILKVCLGFLLAFFHHILVLNSIILNLLLPFISVDYYFKWATILNKISTYISEMTILDCAGGHP